MSERDKRAEGYNLRDEEGRLKDLSTITTLQVCHGNYKTPISHTPVNLCCGLLSDGHKWEFCFLKILYGAVLNTITVHDQHHNKKTKRNIKVG